MTTTLETLTTALLAAESARNQASAEHKACGPNATRAELERTYVAKMARQSEYRAARDAFEAAGGDLGAL
jgi:hypothetical protein